MGDAAMPPPPKKSPTPPETAKLPALKRADDEAFIGHEAPTRVGIDLAQLRQANEGRTTTAPVLAADDVTPTPLGEEDALNLEALEVLSGQKLPARLRRFLLTEAARHQLRYHPSLGGGALRFVHSSLKERWPEAQASRPALLLVPIASCAAGALPLLVAVEVSSAALPVHRYEAQAGFCLLSATFEAFLEALTDEPAGATMALG